MGFTSIWRRSIVIIVSKDSLSAIVTRSVPPFPGLQNCPRDCGECIPKSGDGICSYPFEAAGMGDCNGSKITNFITYKE